MELKCEYKEVIVVLWEYEYCVEFEERCISFFLDWRYKELEKLDEIFEYIIELKELL